MTTLPDVDTLRLCSLLASTAFGAVFLALWARDRGERHLLYWAVSSLSYAAIIFGFSVTPRGLLSVNSLLFAGLAFSNVLPAAGVRRLEGRPAFAWWMPIPPLAAALGYGAPRLALALGGLPAASLLPNVCDALGLCTSMAFCGAALLWGRSDCRTAGHRITGAALLAYIPGYMVSIAGEYGALRGMEALATMAMLSDQALLAIVNLGLLAIPVERAQRQLREAALRDPLTGAWNRAGLELQKRAFLESGATAMAIDIDRFKTINDRHGHAAGDAILALFGREAGQLAQAHGGELARLGGDEFAILLPARCTSPESFARQLRARLLLHAEDAIPWSVSIGMAPVLEGDGGVDAALDRADTSLYRAKAEGSGLISA